MAVLASPIWTRARPWLVRAASSWGRAVVTCSKRGSADFGSPEAWRARASSYFASTEVWVLRDCGAEGGYGLLVATGGVEGAAELEGVVGDFGGEGVGLGELGYGGGWVVLVEVDGAEVEVCGGEVGIEGDSALELGGGLIEFVLLGEEGAEGVVEGGAVGGFAEGELELLLGGGGVAGGGEGGDEVDDGAFVRVGGVESEGGAELGDGGGGVAFGEENGSEGAVGGGDLRSEADGFGELGVGGGEVVAEEGVVSGAEGFSGLLEAGSLSGGDLGMARRDCEESPEQERRFAGEAHVGMIVATELAAFICCLPSALCAKYSTETAGRWKATANAAQQQIPPLRCGMA